MEQNQEVNQEENQLHYHSLKKVEIVLDLVAEDAELKSRVLEAPSASLSGPQFDLSPGELAAINDIVKGTNTSPYVAVPPGSNIDKLSGLRAKWAHLTGENPGKAQAQ